MLNHRALTFGERHQLQMGAPGRVLMRQIAPPSAAHGQPGMDWQAGRCTTCDSRYCGAVCGMVPGTIYVPGQGWVTPTKED